ncbi:MAG: class I SAM-dependent methyltransferase [Hydrotalea sp.]|nr:class I SAM-dependent methyltransferase [Hydrotalea sp.]
MFVKELEDYSWFPSFLRKMQLEYVGWISVQLKLYTPVLALMQRFSSSTWHDLASGSGWPAYYLRKKSNNTIQYTLSDLYPNSLSDEVKNHLRTQIKQVDLTTFIPIAGEQYSMFNAFHHFNNAQQRKFIEKMKDARASCLIVEVLEPSWISFIQVTLAAFLLQPLTAWAIQPFSIVRILTTYLLPIQLLTVAWDGWLSVFKSKSIHQYQHLFNDLANEQFTIEVKRIQQLQGNLVVIIAQSKS